MGGFRDWIGEIRQTFTYDTEGNTLEDIQYQWDLEAGDWIFQNRTVYFWSALTVHAPKQGMDLQYQIYPNPTRDMITIDIDQFDHYSIHITSLNGQFIYGAEMEGTSHQFDLSSFRKGAYFITIRSKDNQATRKIIKL